MARNEVSPDYVPYRPKKAFVTRKVITTVKLVANSADEAMRLEKQLGDHLAAEKSIEHFNPV